MLPSRCRTPDRRMQIVVHVGSQAHALAMDETLYDLARDCADTGKKHSDAIGAIGLGAAVDIEAASRDGCLLSPIARPDPAHLHLTDPLAHAVDTGVASDRPH